MSVFRQTESFFCCGIQIITVNCVNMILTVTVINIRIIVVYCVLNDGKVRSIWICQWIIYFKIIQLLHFAEKMTQSQIRRFRPVSSIAEQLHTGKVWHFHFCVFILKRIACVKLNCTLLFIENRIFKMKIWFCRCCYIAPTTPTWEELWPRQKRLWEHRLPSSVCPHGWVY